MWVNRYADDGPENIRSTILWLTFIFFCGWIGLNVALPNNDLNLVAGVFVVVFSLMALIFYGVPAIKALWSGSFKYTDWLIVGICITALATELREILVIITRLGNLSPSFLNSEWWVPVKMLYPLGYVCHVLPKGAADGEVPKGNVAAVVATFVAATFLSIMLLTIRPSTTDMINGMPGWMKNFWGTAQIEKPIGSG